MALSLLAGCNQGQMGGSWGISVAGDDRPGSPSDPGVAASGGAPLPSAKTESFPSAVPAADRSDVNVFAAQRDERSKKAQDAPPSQLLETHFDIMRIMVPAGAVSRSREFWAQVDEQALPAAQVEHLRNNGVRAGLISQVTWPGVKETLDQIPEPRITRKQLVFRNGYPLELSIDAQPRLNTLFYYLPDGRMPGNSYPNSKRYLHVTHAPNPENFDEVLMVITPEVRQGSSRKTWEWTDNGIRRVTVYEGKVLSELSIVVSVPAGSVLVMGLCADADKPGIFGSAFLTSEIDGRRWETTYLIAPRIVRASMARG